MTLETVDTAAPAVASVALRVLLADPAASADESLEPALRSLGYDVVLAPPAPADAAEAARDGRADLAIIGVDAGGERALALAAALRAACPSIAIVCTGTEAAAFHAAERVVTEAGATAFLGKPVRESALDATLRVAVARARALARAQADLDAATRQRDARDIIRRATQALMERGSSEHEAYRALQRSSQDRSTPMTEIARGILDAGGDS